MMSASTGDLDLRAVHGRAGGSATGATAPMWSKWQWVSRIASTVTPSSATAASRRSASSPGSMTSARSAPSTRAIQQFSWTGPTVS